MPIYEYQCTSCHHEFDFLQKMGDAPLTVCPKCGQPKAIRLVSAAGFQLKGTGWYETDFKHKGKPKPVKESSEGETPAVKEPAKTSEAKGSEN